MAGCSSKSPDNTLIIVNKVFGVIFAVYGPVITTVNILLIISFFATKQPLKNSFNFLIICLSISDNLVGALVMPVLSIENIWYDHEGICSLKKASDALGSCFGGSSLNLTILLAADRYFHMNPDFHTSPSRLAKLFKPPRIYILTLVLLLMLVLVSIYSYFTTELGSKGYNSPVYALFFLVMIVLVLVMYIRGYLRIRRHVEANPFYGNRGEANANESPDYLNELFKTVFLLIISFSVSWLPNLVWHSVIAIQSFAKGTIPSSHAFTVFDRISYVLSYSNSIWSALIIFYRNKKSREWLARLFSSCTRQKAQEEATDTSVVIGNIGAVIDWRRTCTQGQKPIIVSELRNVKPQVSRDQKCHVILLRLICTSTARIVLLGSLVVVVKFYVLMEASFGLVKRITVF